MRCFIALPINKTTRHFLALIAKQLQSQPWSNDVQWFDKENYHLTLQFVGAKVSEQKIQQLLDSMDNWFLEGMSYFEAEINTIQFFPSKVNPHTIIASLDSTILLQSLVREIEQQLKPIGLQPNKHSFRPHISLGRISSKADTTQIKIPESLKKPQNLWLTVDTITCYQSQLTDHAPIYTPLKSILLERY